MTRRDVNEGDVFRKGFATNALEDGATTGQIPAIAADGQMEFVNAGGGSQAVFLSVTQVSSVQIKALVDTPVALVAVPAADKIAMPSAVALVFHAGATPYTQDNPFTTHLLIGFKGASSDIGLGLDKDLLIAIDDGVQSIGFDIDNAGGDLTGIKGTAPVLYMTGTNPTLGDGTLTVSLVYSLLDA